MEPKLKIDEDGNKRYFLNGELHRVGGPAIETANGTKAWYLNGERHRTDGPAIESANGTTVWYINDKRHRLDGPAIEHPNGTKIWYINGEDLTEEITIWLKEYPLPENEVLFKLTWA